LAVIAASLSGKAIQNFLIFLDRLASLAITPLAI